MKFAVDKCPTEEGTFTNLIYVSLDVAKEIDPNYDPSGCKKSYITIKTSKGFAFAISHSDAMKGRDLGFNGIQRKWLGLGLRSEVDVNQIQIKERFLATLTLEVDFLQKNRTSNAKYDTDLMAEEVRSSFLMTPLSLDQNFVFRYQNKQPYLLLRVKEMTLINTAAISGQNKKPINVDMGVITANTIITFDRKEESVISLTGKAVGKSGMPNIINPDWDFSKMGIGGLDDEFSAIFRRAFASRVFPPELIEQLNMTHVKGILLFGPPGTGKTLMARQVGKMLNTREPKIVNGPEILNKYVGESEKNIRELFKEAEEDQKKFKINSPLHMIIFDEIDAICKQRGTVTGSTGVADTVVNQLLSKIDGVEQLNNILIIGMTNRKDLIDEALLRPGRLEVQMEIGLPDEKGRVQILGIHTAKLKESNKLGDDVSLEVLASMTKNFSGAELEGVVRAANTTAMNRLIKVDGKVNIDRDAVENLRVTQSDFLHAVSHDIRPKFGAGSDDADHFIANGIIHYGDPINDILSTATLLINQAKNGKMISPVTVLLQGVQGSGKTALAAHIAYKMSGFPCVKVVSPEKMIGFSEGSKCQTIKNIFDDAGKSELSCIIVDDIERLLDYVPIGPRFSNVVLQSLIVLLKKNLKRGKRLLIIGTSSLNRNVLGMANLQLLPCFNNVIDVPTIHDIDSMVTILRETGHLTENQILEIQQEIARRTTELDISVKRLTSLVEMASEADEDSVVLEFVTLMRDYFAK